jgi:hypothetical protein
MRSLRTLALVAGLAVPAILSAQTPAAKRTVLSFQPLSAMYTVYSGELERAVSPSTTLGIGASYWGHEQDGESLDYLSGDLKLRYYPQGKALEGFSFGLQAGYTSVKETIASGLVTTSNEELTHSAPTAGVALDYGWLLGADKKFYMGLGVGAKRIFADNENDASNLLNTYPTARISIGMAF